MKKLLEYYTLKSPIRAGKSRIQKYLFAKAKELNAITKGGYKFHLTYPEDIGLEDLYYQKTHESGTTDILKFLINRDSNTLDIGANLGWYSIHCATISPNGKVHAFEPHPKIFNSLQKNIKLNKLQNIVLNQKAFSDSNGTIKLFQFDDYGHGHCSTSDFGKQNTQSFDVESITINNYLKSNDNINFDLVKIDVEGAEMNVLSSASDLFKQEILPSWIIEMNKETAESFGHKPEDILEKILSYGQHTIYRVNLAWGNTYKMKNVSDYKHGDNVIMIPKSRLEVISQIENIAR
ncbi:MAG: hypothetical protein Kapaf2KO_19290 [Candidatus Kapaibacteriales bacterium]